MLTRTDALKFKFSLSELNICYKTNVMFKEILFSPRNVILNFFFYLQVNYQVQVISAIKRNEVQTN